MAQRRGSCGSQSEAMKGELTRLERAEAWACQRSLEIVGTVVAVLLIGGVIWALVA